MSRLRAVGAGLGDAVDELGAVARTIPGHIRRTLAVRRYRLVALAVGLAYLLLYLVALGDVDISTGGRYGRFASTPSADLLAGWEGKLFAERAPFLYEPIAVVYLLPQLALFVSAGNILIGSALAVLLGLNVALALEAAARVEACRRHVYTSALGVLPTFLMGFACCAPTFILALGTNVAAAFLPVFIPLRSFLLPLALALMAGMLLWSVRRLRRAEAALARPLANGRVSGVRAHSSARDALTIR